MPHISQRCGRSQPRKNVVKPGAPGSVSRRVAQISQCGSQELEGAPHLAEMWEVAARKNVVKPIQTKNLLTRTI